MTVVSQSLLKNAKANSRVTVVSQSLLICERVVAKEYLEEVWGLAIRISGAISEALGLERDYVEKSLGEGCQIVASNYYPPCPEPHRTLGLAAHSDHGGITILMQNEVDGLQVKHQGEWVAVHHVPGTLVVNIGDYIEVILHD